MQGMAVRRSLKWTVMTALLSLPVCAASAAVESYDFKLRMSEDEKLCLAITEVLAKEYSNAFVQLPPRHEWFIRWNVLDSLGEQFRDEPRFIDDGCSLYRWAQFDIDNDGRVEIVIKWSACLGGVRSDTLYVFHGEEARDRIYQAIMNPFALSDSPQREKSRARLLGKISYTGEIYELKKLPPFKNKHGHEEFPSIGGKVFVHPFLFEGQTYLNLYGLSGMHVIARYRQTEKISEQLDDVCYVDRTKISR